MIEILLLQVMAQYKQVQFDEAPTTLERAITLAQPGGFICPFVETALELTRHLEKLGSQDAAPDYIGQILNALLYPP